VCDVVRMNQKIKDYDDDWSAVPTAASWQERALVSKHVSRVGLSSIAI
jgi:hypothetical protein